MLRLETIIKTICFYVLACFFILIISPHAADLASHRISSDDVKYRPVISQYFTYRFEVVPAAGDLTGQFTPRQSGARRFKFTFQDDYPFDNKRAVYIPNSGGKTHIILNGALIDTSHPHKFFVPSWGQDWIKTDIPRNMLVSGSNRIDIYVMEDPFRSGLREIYLGPSEVLDKAMMSQITWFTHMPVFIIIMSLIIVCLCVFGVVIGRRRTAYVSAGITISIGLFQAALSFVGDVTPFVDMQKELRTLLPLLMLIGCGLCFWALRHKHAQLYGVYPALFLLAITGPLAALIYMYVPIYAAGQIPVATIILAGHLPVFGCAVITDFVDDITRRRSRLETLKVTVSKQSAELDEKTESLVKEMRNRALLEERERFTRDIHDGIGGQLLSLLLRIRTEDIDKDEIENEIQTGLHDLRLVVDSLDNMGTDLTAALSTFKLRSEPQIRAAKIEFEWTQQHPLRARIQKQGGTLNLYRFMQEALTNIVRHAQADKIEIIIDDKTDSRLLTIKIIDDGIGFLIDDQQHSSEQLNVASAAKGLRNLKTRAAALGAKMVIESKLGEGTRITLSVPIVPETVVDV